MIHEGYKIELKRRRYCKTTYTWVSVLIEDKFRTSGDPFPKLRPSKADLTAAVSSALKIYKTETIECFKQEYERLYKWRELWQRLSNRSDKTPPGTLQSRYEAVQRRALIKNNQIAALMRKYDLWREIFPGDGAEVK